MSGSPIIQDGKIIGAVTHVVVDDPTKGYGTFITKMLEEAENQKRAFLALYLLLFDRKFF